VSLFVKVLSMKILLYVTMLGLGASCLAACSDNAPPETGKTRSTDQTIVNELHDPIDRAKGVSTLLQDAAETNKQEIEKQAE
jgi:hypothetical protein